MRKSEAQPLKGVIQEYIEAIKMSSKIKEVSLINVWEKIASRPIIKATKDLYIKDRILYITLNSSVIRNELEMIKEPLAQRLNTEVNADVIDAIVFR